MLSPYNGARYNYLWVASILSVYAVVPVKAPLKSKSRLSRILNQKERLTLTLTMLEDVLRALKSSVVNKICVISSDSRVQAWTKNFEVAYLSENQRGLNQAIEQATEWCIHNSAASVLVLPADIPLITCEDINQIVKLGFQEGSVVISPSRNGGTNALLQKPPNLIPASFGLHSFWKHVGKATAKRASIRFYSSKRVTFDIDSLNDLKDFLKIESQTMSRQFLEQIRLRDRLMNIESHDVEAAITEKTE